MERLAEALSLPAEQCSYICLPGHQRGESVGRLTASQWLDSFAEQYHTQQHAHKNLIFVGYSLGGLIMTYLLAAKRLPAPKKQILLAPALAFKHWTKIPTYLPATTLDQILIPSLTPKHYKANPGVTIGAYKVLFEISKQLEDLPSVSYNIPTLVLCDQRDELVKPQGLQQFIQQQQLSKWQLYIIPSSPWKRWGKKHLLVAPEHQSDEHWKEVRSRIDHFLNA